MISIIIKTFCYNLFLNKYKVVLCYYYQYINVKQKAVLVSETSGGERERLSTE